MNPNSNQCSAQAPSRTPDCVVVNRPKRVEPPVESVTLTVTFTPKEARALRSIFGSMHTLKAAALIRDNFLYPNESAEDGFTAGRRIFKLIEDLMDNGTI